MSFMNSKVIINCTYSPLMSLNLFIDPIIALDSSRDGKWLLATTDHYLLIYPTFSGNVDGYKKGIRKTKTGAIRIELPANLLTDAEDEQGFQLLPASFDSSLETHQKLRVLSAFKSCLLTWTFDTAKRSIKLHKVLNTGSQILEIQFVAGRDDQALVATVEELRIVKI